MLISPDDYPAEAAARANISASTQKKIFLKKKDYSRTFRYRCRIFIQIHDSAKLPYSSMTASEYFMKEYNTVQVTKKSPFKAPKTASSLQTPPANKVCKSTMMQVFCFGGFCVCVCEMEHRAAQVLLSPRVPPRCNHVGSWDKKKKNPFQMKERRASLSQVKLGDMSGEISPLAKWRGPLVSQVMPAVTQSAGVCSGGGPRVVAAGEGWGHRSEQ